MPRLFAANLLTAASFLSGLSLAAGDLTIRPEQVVAPLLFAGLLMRRRVAPMPGLAVLVVVWIAAGVFGAFGEPEAGRAFVHAARLLATACPVVLLPALLANAREAESAWDGFLVLATLESVLALLLFGAHEVFGTTIGVTVEQKLGYAHPQGTLLEPNLLGALAGCGAVALLLRAFDRALSRRARLGAFAAAAVLLAAVAASVTRASWIAVPLVLGIVATLWRRRVPRSVLLAAAAGALVLVTALVLPLQSLREALETRSGITGKLASFTRLAEDPNVSVRLASYTAALALFRESPIVGAGHGAMERIPGAEDRRLAWAGNLEVHILADTGLAGLAALTAFVCLVLARVLRSARAATGEARRRQLERFGALLVLLLCAQATETSWLSSFWVLFGLALAAARPEERRGTEDAREGPEPVPARRTRILYVHPSDELYGSDRVLLELVRRLDRDRFEPRVLVSSDVPYAGRLTRRLAELGVPVTRLRIGVLRRRALSSPLRAMRFSIDVLVSTARIARLLAVQRIDIVHANTVTVFPAALAARLSGRRLVWHLHEIVTDRPGRALLHVLVRSLAHRVVVVSEAARRALGRHGAAAEVVPNGVERREGALPPADPPVIAYVGRLSERKGPRVLLRAAARVAERHPRARFVFAGDEFGGGGAMRDALEADARSLGLARALEIRPFDEDVSGLLAEATAIVSPSILPESFGLVLLEAMASGRAVVASDHGGPRELVVDGVTGFLVPPGDDAALAGALERLLSDRSLAERLGERGRLRARERFAIEDSVARFEAIYDEVVASSTSAVLPSSRRAPHGRPRAS